MFIVTEYAALNSGHSNEATIHLNDIYCKCIQLLTVRV